MDKEEKRKRGYFEQREKERKRKILATEDTEILFFLQREKEKEVKMEKGLWNENRD